MGIVDPDRVVVGGHSYGAFMTANLLAHSDIFRAGIARSGAYNRTLTPFGFQNEQRTFWEVPDVYMRMSPFCQRPEDQGADPADSRRGRRQLGDVPDPVGALLRGAEGPRRHGALRDAAVRGARLPGRASRCCTPSPRCSTGRTGGRRTRSRGRRRLSRSSRLRGLRPLKGRARCARSVGLGAARRRQAGLAALAPAGVAFAPQAKIGTGSGLCLPRECAACGGEPERADACPRASASGPAAGGAKRPRRLAILDVPLRRLTA